MNIKKCQSISMNIYKFLLVSVFFLVFFFAVAPGSAHAADFYWVGDGGNWSDYATHWATASGGVTFQANAPTSADNCHFDANSFTGASQTVTVDAAANCLNMDWTGVTNSPTLAGSSTIGIYGALTTENMTWTHTGGLNFLVDSHTTHTFNGVSLATTDISFGATVGYQNILADDLTCGDLTTVRTNFITGNNTVNCGAFTKSSATGSTATWTLGTSTINCTSLNIQSTSGFAVSAASSTINISGTGQFVGRGYTFGTVNLNGTSHTISGNNTFTTLRRTGTATKTDSLTFTAGSTQTATNFALIGNSATNRVLIQSSTLGTDAHINATNQAFSNVDFMDIYLGTVYDQATNIVASVSRDMETGNPPTGWGVSGAGITHSQSTDQAYSPTHSDKVSRDTTFGYNYYTVTPAILYRGIPLIATMWTWASAASTGYVNIYWDTANNSSSAHTGDSTWQQLTATGTMNTTSTVLYVQGWVNTNSASVYFDDASLQINSTIGDAGGNSGITFTTAAAQTWDGTTGSWSDSTKWTSRVPLPQDDVSAGGTGNTITVDMPRIGKSITFTGTPTVSLSNDISNYGSWTMVSGMTYTHNSKGNYFRGRGSYNLTSAGKTLYQVMVYVPTGTLTLQDSLTSSSWMIFDGGTFDTNDKNITGSSWYHLTTVATVLWLRSSVITLSYSSGQEKFWFTASGITVNAGTSTINLVNTSSTAQKFYGSNQTYNNVTVSGSGTGSLTIYGNNTFNTFTVDRSQAAKTVNFTAGTTQTFSNFLAPVSGTTVLTINSDTTATHALVKTGGGTISSDYLNIQHSVATPAYTWYAGANSTNNQAVETAGSGWIFSAAYKTLVGKDIDAYQVMTDGSNVYGYINTSNVVSTPLSSGVWHHVTMTYDGATQKIYVDGVLKSSGAVSGAIGTNTSNVEIGQNFAGKIDNVKIYNRALSSAEILASAEAYNPSVQISDLQKGLVGHWDFNGNMKDSTPYANNGSVGGGSPTLTTDRKGQVNKAYSFDGNDYIDAGNAASLNITDEITLETWAYRIGDTGAIIDRPSYIYAIMPAANNAVIFYINNIYLYGSNNKFPYNQWVHITAIAKSSTYMKIYINGVFDTQKTSGVPAFGVTDVSLKIGMKGSGTYSYFNGTIDDVRIYNRALSAEEVLASYELYDPGIQVSDLQKGLVGQWKMDGNAKDSTPYGNNGTVTGATLNNDRKGQANKAYSFDGTDDYAITPSSNVFAYPGDFTIISWIYMKSQPAVNSVVLATYDVAYGTGGLTGIIINPNTGVGMGRTGIDVQVTSDGPISLNTWHFIVVKRSGSAVTILTDNVQTGSGTVTTSYKQGKTILGVDNNLSSNFFNGLIDDVRIYNRALSQTEITALYQSY